VRALIGRIAASACYWLPAALLVSVATNQLRLVDTASLSPWSGGGFGMFSSVDSPGHRHLHAFVLNQDIRREVALPRDMKEAVLRATTLPTPERLAALAIELARLESDDTIRWDEIELQVWTVNYNAGSLSPSGRLVRKERYDIAPR
jgi:hypothetical protein